MMIKVREMLRVEESDERRRAERERETETERQRQRGRDRERQKERKINKRTERLTNGPEKRQTVRQRRKEW